MHVCMYVCIINISIGIYMYARMYVCMYVCIINISIGIYMYARMYNNYGEPQLICTYILNVRNYACHNYRERLN